MERNGDLISRQAAIDLLKKWSDGYSYIEIETNSAIKAFEEMLSAHLEYTENEEKVLVMMFTIVKNILDLQDGYMNIDDMSFGHNELFNLSEKLGIDY